ncbi:hypothetical protein [Botrimarina mediterranea]|uniref:Uncharacterized protein n=1 Tax=Botrimarina mediterranea TaxID=2528022 RepID=A0A518K290_9BACT|nr:hypothetical protein [Botrimarina mediterranea]QDV71923.1 hypothetical protein Spa11_00920 [Botrimarina mediterranea]QDV76464.1 hypothetical protein K2D_00420 [Planctomycetes bacterium K2D]
MAASSTTSDSNNQSYYVTYPDNDLPPQAQQPFLPDSGAGKTEAPNGRFVEVHVDRITASIGSPENLPGLTLGEASENAQPITLEGETRFVATWGGIDIVLDNAGRATGESIQPWLNLDAAGEVVLRFTNGDHGGYILGGPSSGELAVDAVAGTALKVAGKAALPVLRHVSEKIANATKGKLDDVVNYFKNRFGGTKTTPDVQAPRRIGAAILDPDNFDDWDRAEEIYDQIRRSTTDVDEIAKNSGIPRSTVERVKNHLFNNEHLLDDEVRGRSMLTQR